MNRLSVFRTVLVYAIVLKYYKWVYVPHYLLICCGLGQLSRYSDCLEAERSEDRFPVERDFAHPSRPAPVSTKPPIQGVSGLSRRKAAGRGLEN